MLKLCRFNNFRSNKVLARYVTSNYCNTFSIILAVLNVSTHLGYVLIVNRDAARVNIIEPKQQLHYCTLPTPTGPYYSH